MDQRDASTGAESSQFGRTIAIGVQGRCLVLFRRVHGGVGGGVDDQPWICRLKRRGDGRGFVEVKIRTPEKLDPLRALGGKGRGQLSRSTRDHDWPGHDINSARGGRESKGRGSADPECHDGA
jgi:hypothetical protein